MLHSLDVIVVSQAPSLESNLNSRSPVTTVVGTYPTIKVARVEIRMMRRQHEDRATRQVIMNHISDQRAKPMSAFYLKMCPRESQGLLHNSRITTVIRVACTIKQTIIDLTSHSMFRSSNWFILAYVWLNL